MKTRLSIVLLALGALIFAPGCSRTETALLVGAAIVGTAIALDHDDHHHHHRHRSHHYDYHHSSHHYDHSRHYDYDYCD